MSTGPANSPFDSDQPRDATAGQPGHQAGWYADPTRRFEFRYFNGSAWTADVSMHGQRQIDNGGPTGSRPQWGPAAPTSQPPGRGFAVASFVLALGALLIGWIPFIFVLAIGAAITALVFAVIGIRRARATDGRGMGFAVTGAVLAPIALGVCVVGFLLTRLVLDEVDKFVDPGEYELVENQPCEVVDGVASFTGSITNLDAKSTAYTLTVTYLDVSPEGSRRRIPSDSVNVAEVAPGQSAIWQSVRLVGDAESVECNVVNVYGPTPFGLDRQQVVSP